MLYLANTCMQSSKLFLDPSSSKYFSPHYSPLSDTSTTHLTTPPTVINTHLPLSHSMAPKKHKTQSSSHNHIYKRLQLGQFTTTNKHNHEEDHSHNNYIPSSPLPSSSLDTHHVKLDIAWRSTIVISVIHAMGIFGGILWISGQISAQTFFIQWVFGMLSALGTTAGAHRYWAHRSYHATFLLQIFLATCQTISCQNSIYEWVRDHRAHHKFTETDADPHNAKRGFFFAHMGWLLVRKHPDVKSKGSSVDMSDLKYDPIVTFQRRHYIPLVIIFCFFIPTWVVAYSGDSWRNAWFVTMFRYILSLHFTWLVNSAAHLWGPRPYDININPSENLWVSLLAGGEGWHNYHHVFPWDYKTSELGLYRVNMTALFIDLCAWLGLAYGLKTVPREVVKQRMTRTGDGSQYRH